MRLMTLIGGYMFVSEGDIILKGGTRLDDYAIEGVIRWWDDTSNIEDVYNFPYKDVRRQEVEIIDDELYVTGNMEDSYSTKVIRKMFKIGRFADKNILVLNFDINVQTIDFLLRQVIDHDTSMYSGWLQEPITKYVYKSMESIGKKYVSTIASFHCLNFSNELIASKESTASRIGLSEYVVREKIDLVIGCGGYVKKGFVSQDDLYFDLFINNVKKKLKDLNRIDMHALVRPKFLKFTI